MDINSVKIGNPYTHQLGSDFFAVDADGEPFARATTLDAVRLAAPDATGYFTTDDFWLIVREDNLPHPRVILDIPETHGVYIYLGQDRVVLAAGYYNYDKAIPAQPVGTVSSVWGGGDTDLPTVGDVFPTLDGDDLNGA